VVAAPEVVEAGAEVVEIVEFVEDAAGEPEILDIVAVVDADGNVEVLEVDEIVEETAPDAPATTPEPEAGAAPTS
jgi:hypothetical protein